MPTSVIGPVTGLPSIGFAGASLEQTSNHQHERALAASRWTDHRHEFAGVNIDRDLLQRLKGRVTVFAENLGYAADADRNTGLPHFAILITDASTAVNGTFETSSALRPRCTTRSRESRRHAKTAIACVGLDLLSRNSAMR